MTLCRKSVVVRSQYSLTNEVTKLYFDTGRSGKILGEHRLLLVAGPGGLYDEKNFIDVTVPSRFLN